MYLSVVRWMGDNNYYLPDYLLYYYTESLIASMCLSVFPYLPYLLITPIRTLPVSFRAWVYPIAVGSGKFLSTALCFFLLIWAKAGEGPTTSTATRWNVGDCQTPDFCPPGRALRVVCRYSRVRYGRLGVHRSRPCR